MAWESGTAGGWSNGNAAATPLDFTFGYVASPAIPDPGVGAAVGQQEYFTFFVTHAPIQAPSLPFFNPSWSKKNPSGGYIRVPARFRRI